MREGYNGAAPVLVTGAGGNVGRGVVARLAAAGVPVRAAVTHGSGGVLGPTADARRGGHIEEVRFDFTDSSTWPAAFEGAEQMFLLRPPHLGRPRVQMLPSLEAARAAGVRQVVLLSLQGAEHNRVVPHATLETWLRGSGLDWTFVRPSFFMQNLTSTHLSDIRDRGELVVPAGRGATAFVDADDVAAVAVAALLQPQEHRNRSWTPTGPAALTYSEVADALSRALGRHITYTAPGAVRYAAHARTMLGMPWDMVAVTTAIYTVARLGRAGDLTDDVHVVTGTEPRSFEDFARRHATTWQPSSLEETGRRPEQPHQDRRAPGTRF